MNKKIARISLLFVLLMIVCLLSNTQVFATQETVSNLEELQNALEGTSDEIIITQTITLPDGTILNGNNKTVRVAIPYIDSNGQYADSPSTERVFIIETNSNITIKNMVVMGGKYGGSAAISNRGHLIMENVDVARSNRGIDNDGGTAVLKKCNFVYNVARSAGAIWSGNGAKLILDDCSFSNNRSNGGSSCGGGAIGVSGSSSYLLL